MIDFSAMVNGGRAVVGRTLRRIAAGMLAAAVGVASGAARAAPDGAGSSASFGPRVGQVAPPLALERLSGSDGITLEALRGRVVVIDFWATWCVPCRAVMPGLDALSRRHREAGLTVLGIAREPEAHIRAHLAERPVSYTVARDVGGTLRRYGVRALPTLVVLDRAGQVREVFVGMDGASFARLERAVQRLLFEPSAH